MAGTNVGQLELDLLLNSDGFKTQLQSAVDKAVTQTSTETGDKIGKAFSAKMSSAFSKLGKLAVAAFSVRAITGFTKSSVELGSTLQEVQNVVDTTFTTMNKDVNAFASSAMKQFGLSEAVAKKYVGTMGAMAKSFGFAEQEAFNMSTTLTGLVGDVASFYNLSSDEAYTKLKAVFTGETEALKELGVVMTQAALDEFALAKGYSKTTAAMTEQEKVALRYKFVQEQLSTATGDFIRTQGGWANQTRILTLQWQSLKANIGQAFISILTPLIQHLNLFIERLVSATAKFKEFIQSIFGVQVDTGTSELEESLPNISDSLDKSTESAKKLKKSLMGFDNLNVLNNETSVGTTVGSSVEGTAAENDNSKGQSGYEGVFNWGEKIKDLIASINKKIANFDAAALGKKLSELVSKAFTSISETINSVDWITIGTKVGEFIAAIDWKSVLESVGKLIWESINAGIELWKGMFDAAPVETTILTALALLKFTGVGSLIMTAIKNALVTKLGAESGTGLGTALLNWIKNGVATSKIGTFFSGIGTKIGTWLTTSFGSVGAGLGGIATGITGAILGFTNFFSMLKDGFSWFKEILMVIGVALAAVAAVILGAPAAVAAIAAAVVAAVATAVVFIKDNWGKITTWFSEKIESIGTWWSKTWDNICTWFSETLTNIKTWWAETWDNIIEFFSGFGDNVKTAFGTIISWFGEKLDGLKQKFWDIFDNIKDKVVGVFDSIKTAIKTPINAIIGMLNKMIRGINKLDFDMPEWVPVVGGKSLGFNIPEIPQLAEGGYVRPNTPQLAMIGDNRHQGEIVAPEGKLNEAVASNVRPILTAIQQLLSVLTAQGQGNGGDITIPIYLDGSILDEYVVSAQDRKALRSGGIA